MWDSLARALLFLVTLSLLALRTDTAAQYVKNFEDFKIKEKKNPIPAITRDLQFNVDYINNPCLLAPTAEVAPLMAIDELQRQYKVFYLLSLSLYSIFMPNTCYTYQSISA